LISACQPFPSTVGYQFTVEFKPGKQNVAADSLSRRDEEPPVVFAQSLPRFELYDQLRTEATTLQAFIDQRAAITVGTAGLGWSIIDDVITFKGRIFLLQS
jgi:hypothetical protein